MDIGLLKSLLHARYALHFFYSSKTDYNEPNVEPVPELEVAELVPEIEQEPEPDVIEEPELESEVDEALIETL